MKPLVIYHSADFDGAFCREVARKYFGDEGAEYVGWDYGQPEPVVDLVRPLFILDLSVPSLMEHPRLTWIDHHGTAIAKYGENARGYRIDGVAACRLAYQWFFHPTSPQNPHLHPFHWKLPTKEDFVGRKVREPEAIRLAGEYDIWDKRDPNAEVFQHGLRSQDLTKLWEPLVMVGTAWAETVVHELLRVGAALQYAQQRSDESVIRHNGFTVQFEGLTFLALNTVRCNSLTFSAGLKPEHDACLAFGWNGRKWRCSLYGVPGKPDVNLAPIAVRYGGGGHKQACGFEVTTLPFQL